uniref:Pulmonary surfactant-associated protein B n=1 Tax=Hirondellea gigas TaxID=1518452 RepID=A0A2P2HY13_9CRUS
MFTALLLSSILVVVTQGALVGSQQCTYGPAFWCSSLRNAKQCSAVSHCIQSVWEKQQLPEDNDDICNICKNMVQEARDQLESNQTQEDLKAVLDGACRLIPLREISSECIELANDFIPELIETLASQMNPQIVCATAGLCNSVRIDRILREMGQSHNSQSNTQQNTDATSSNSVSDPDPGDCDDCRRYVEDTIKLVSEHSKQELLDHLLSICGELGSVSDGCSALMSVNIDDIYDYLANKLNPNDACRLFGMCNNQFGPLPKPASANTGDEVCDFCVVITQHWRDIMTSNTTEEEFQEIMEGICEKTGSFKDECKSLVDNYYLAAYNYLINQFDPKKLCEVVGICTSNIHNGAIWTTLHTGPVPANALIKEEGSDSFDRSALTFVGQDEANSYKLRENANVLPRANLRPSIKITVAGEKGVLDGGDQACTMCEFTLHFIQIQLQDKRTKEEIENVVKSVCNYMPKDLRENCDDYVDAYGDQVIALLQQEIDPSVMCPMLGLCPSNNSVTVAAPPTPGSSKADVSCIGCEFIMIKLKELLGTHSNQEAVKEALDKVCGLLPHSISDECQTFVDQNAIEVMQLLAGGVEPEQICHLLGLCHDNLGSLPPLDASYQLPVSRLFVHRPRLYDTDTSSLEHVGQSKVCVVCEFVLATVQKLVLDNNTHIKAEIEKAVEQVCMLFPSTLQEDCLGFVEQYGESLVDLLVNGLEPEMICRELHLCKQPNLYGLPHAIVTRAVAADEPTTAVSDERRCLICTAVVTTYKGSSRDSGGDAATITAAVENVCSALTGQEQQLCSSMDVSSAVEGSTSSSTAICATLGYCPRPQHLIGSEKCTWGPSYWCQSQLHSQSCGATAHCQDRVWEGGVAPA